MWNKILHHGSARLLIERRRLALSNKNIEEYKQICKELKVQLEANLDSVTKDVLKKIKMPEEVYYGAKKHYS